LELSVFDVMCVKVNPGENSSGRGCVTGILFYFQVGCVD